MTYRASIEGFEGQNIDVNISFWSGPKLLINGQPAPKGTRPGEMLLRRNDGKQIIAMWKMQLLGLDVPQLIADGKVVNLVRPLKWFEWLWGGLPVLLTLVGGAVGAIAGLIAFSINTRVFRMELNGVLKYVFSGLVSILAVVVYLVIAVMISNLAGK